MGESRVLLCICPLRSSGSGKLSSLMDAMHPSKRADVNFMTNIPFRKYQHYNIPLSLIHLGKSYYDNSGRLIEMIGFNWF